jgi:hypothetical protein
VWQRIPWRLLWTWAAGLLACAVLGKVVRSPFPWIFLVLAGLSAGTWRALGASAARRAALSLTTAWLALAVLELLLLTAFPSPELDRETDYGQMLEYRAGLGSALRPGTWSSSSWLGWWEVYDATYTIGPHGWRTTGPPREEAASSVLCFGGSFVFGQGLDDGASWPWLLASELGDGVQVVNLGVPGWGPGQMLALAGSPELDEPVEAPPRLVVHLAIPGHARRVSGEAPWSAGFPRYELSPDGAVTRRGSHPEPAAARERGALERFLRRNLRRAAVIRRLRTPRQPASRTSDGERIELWAAVVERSRAVLEERYPGVRFLVVFWDGSAPGAPRFERQETMIEALRARELEVVRASAWLPDLASDPAWIIPIDRHPSARAAEALARGLAAWWRERE